MHIYRFLDVITLQNVCDKQVSLDTVDLAPVEQYEPTPQPIMMADKRVAAVS